MSKRQANSNSTKIILIAFSILQKRGDVNLPYIIRLKFIVPSYSTSGWFGNMIEAITESNKIPPITSNEYTDSI